MNQYNEFIQILAALDKKKVEYILVGGFAIFLHGIRRFTQDLDIFLRLVPPNVDNLREALKSVFDDPSIDEITFHELQEYPVIRYGTPTIFILIFWLVLEKLSLMMILSMKFLISKASA